MFLYNLFYVNIITKVSSSVLSYKEKVDKYKEHPTLLKIGKLIKEHF